MSTGDKIRLQDYAHMDTEYAEALKAYFEPSGVTDYLNMSLGEFLDRLFGSAAKMEQWVKCLETARAKGWE
jgi:hypothetical protein